MHELYRGIRGHAPPEKTKMKIGLSETPYHTFPGSNAINSDNGNEKFGGRGGGRGAGRGDKQGAQLYGIAETGE